MSYSTLTLLEMAPVRQATLWSRFWGRVRDSLQFMPDLGASSVWMLMVSFSALFPLWQHGHRSHKDFAIICAIWLVGSFLACFIARVLARFFAGGRGEAKRFAAMIFFLFIFTVIVPASLFSLQYRLYFSQWHDDFLTKFWFIEFIFTGANSFYLFVATAIAPLITPQGVLLAFAFCWFFKPEIRGHQNITANTALLDKIRG